MLKPMNLQLFAEPGDSVPTSEPALAAGKTYSEDYVSVGNVVRNKAEGLLHDNGR